MLILNNVHIRYEDSLTLPNDLVFSCGARIQKITVQTTNSQWKPGFVEPLDGMNVFKKLELKGFSLYWSSDEILSKNIDSPKQLRNIMTPDDQSNAHIIQPCSAELRMEKNSSKFPLKGSSPRFKLYLRSEKITCELSRRQMAELRALNREWMRFERARQHRKWRPLNHVSTHAAEWWRFAYDRICDESRRMQSRRTWHFALTRARHLNAYCRAYRRRLLSLIGNPVDRIPHYIVIFVFNRGPQIDVNDEKRKTSSLISGGSQEDKAIMKQIERDVEYTYYLLTLIFQELYLFRETVFRRLIRDKEREKGIDFVLNEDTFETIDVTTEDLECETMRKEEGKGLYGWFTSFFMQEENEEEKEETFDFGKLDLSELKKLPQSFNFKDMEEEILDVLHESWDDSTLLRRDLLLAEIALRLEHITLRFIDTSVVNNVEQRRVLAMDLTGVTARVELSPRQHFLSVSLSGSSSEIDESLMYSLAESTKILLAVGRKNDDVVEKEPMFRPVSIIYEENALVGLSNLFADDPAILKATFLLDIRYATVHGNQKISMGTEGNISEEREVYMQITFVDAKHPHFESTYQKVRFLSFSTPIWDIYQMLVLVNCTNLLARISSFFCKSVFIINVFFTFIGRLSSMSKTYSSKLIINSTSAQNLFLVIIATILEFLRLIVKKNCSVEIELGELEMGLNRRTWTALMDLAGLLGAQESDHNSTHYKCNINLRIRSALNALYT
uniref:VPS13 domain-containing protein n=1 Tax=Heterorhabditis bacteriophora TaxID=37862 RepID=A0A1I7WZT6_HETBA